MSKNRKEKQTQNVGTGETFENTYKPTEGIVNGKANDEISNAFSKVGFRLYEGKKPTKKFWSILPEGMKNHYRRQYAKLTKGLE